MGRWKVLIVVMCLVLVDVQSSAGEESQKEGTVRANSFDECVAETGTILKIYPPKCVTKDGRVFVQVQQDSKKSCKDLCGDGECQEMVCMAVGCPCAESLATCPKDCSF